MDYKPLKIGNKVAGIPIIQGGMGIGISLGNLAGAVAKEGGVGVISAAQIGFAEPDFDTHTKEANLRAIHKEYEKARKTAPDGIIGFNLMVAMSHYEDYVKEVVKAGADIIISGAGLPMDLPAYVGDGEICLAPIVSSEKAARVLLRNWDRKYHRIPDLIVVEGPLAGGHLGFSKEQLETCMLPEGILQFENEIRKIRDTVRDYEQRYGKKIPVAVAGGIENTEDVRHAFSLGADAVQVATRFVTTEECDADIRYKEAYLKAGPKDIVIVKSPVGMPGRAINNTFMQRVNRGEQIPHTPCHGCLRKCRPSEIPYCITDALIHAAKGETEEALLFCGANAWRAEKIETVHETIQSLMA